MKLPARTTAASSPDASSTSSLSLCSRPMASAGSAANSDDRKTTRGLPCSLAIAINWRNSPPSSAPFIMKTASTPATACAKVSGSVKFPATACTWSPHRATFAVSRVKTRTERPWLRSRSTTWLPTFPVAPVTRIMVIPPRKRRFPRLIQRFHATMSLQWIYCCNKRTMTLELNDLQYFVRVAEDRSFTQAARRLKVPKSTVSRALKRLEKRLGLRLVERTTRRVSLTEVGELYMNHCRRVMEEAEEADLAVGALLAEPGGRLSVRAPVPLPRFILRPLLADF